MTRMQQLFVTLVTVCLMLSVTTAKSVRAQSIVINPEEAVDAFEKAGTRGAITLINGARAAVLRANGGNSRSGDTVKLGAASKLVWSLVALRLVDQGLIDLDRPLAEYLPDTFDKYPFEVAITARHLLTESAGFAVPPWGEAPGTIPLPGAVPLHGRIKPYLIKIRSAGQVPYDDPVGWGVLLTLLQRVSSMTPDSLLMKEILTPLGLDRPALRVGASRLPEFIAPAYALEATPDGLDAVLSLILRNRAGAAGPYISLSRHREFFQSPTWQLHPLGPKRSLFAPYHEVKGQPVLEISDPGGEGPDILLAPVAGVAFWRVPPTGHPRPDGAAAFFSTGRALLERLLPGRQSDENLAETRALRLAGSVTGYYMRADRPSAWLRHRFSTMADGTLYVQQLRGDRLKIEDRTGGPDIYQMEAPLVFKAATGQQVIFSVGQSNGYLLRDGILYRYAGFFGNPALNLDPLLWSVLVLLTGAVYWRSRGIKPWRSMARFCLFGPVLLGIGLYGEMVYWPGALYVADNPWIVLLWRAALNIGLMLILATAFLALSIARRGEIGPGWMIAVRVPHLAILAAAAFYLVYASMVWGVLGELWPY